MNKLHKMGAETLGQMIENEDISKNFSPSLKDKMLKVGMAAVMATVLSISSGMAHAGDNNSLTGMLGLSALTGLLANNTKPADAQPNNYQGGQVDCNAAKSGVKIGASGALGAFVGNHIGQGNGNVAATVAGGLLGMVVANSMENDRIRTECQRVPNWNNNIPANQAILYEGRRSNGGSFYVTVGDSPGIAGLSGKIQGQLDVNQDPIVRNAMEKGSVGLVVAYDNLDATARNYYAVLNGKTTAGKLSRYAIDPQEVSAGGATVQAHQMQITQAKMELDAKYTEYARIRSAFANVADNAVQDGYNITAYGQALPYFTPPKTVNVLFNGNTVNRYETLPNAVRP